LLKIKPFLNHLSKSEDLITTYEQTRAGFIALALEKNRRATPTVIEARNLQTLAAQAKKPIDLIHIMGIKSALITAAGISAKAEKHLTNADKNEAIKGLISNFLEPAGLKFVEELVYRFLLIRGDSLGGSLRNLAGAFAQQKFTRTLIGLLSIDGRKFSWFDKNSKKWISGNKDHASIELNARGISWSYKTENRFLLYNRKIPFIGNNIDLNLLHTKSKHYDRNIVRDPSNFIALGELKGGIDPAGADEHWKTARTSLTRIREGFVHTEHSPFTFFAGAAIEKKMADEIWDQLQNGILSNAANITNQDQIVSLCKWIIDL